MDSQSENGRENFECNHDDHAGGGVTLQMSLYLDNSATQSILLKPISKKICKAACDVINGENG
jgi:hypothetical protein